jgi:hypothetical protein
MLISMPLYPALSTHCLRNYAFYHSPIYILPVDITGSQYGPVISKLKPLFLYLSLFVLPPSFLCLPPCLLQPRLSPFPPSPCPLSSFTTCFSLSYFSILPPLISLSPSICPYFAPSIFSLSLCYYYFSSIFLATLLCSDYFSFFFNEFLFSQRFTIHFQKASFIGSSFCGKKLKRN